MLLNVLMNEFILVLWKRRGWWLLGGLCWCEWLSCEACWDGSADICVSPQQVHYGQGLWKSYTALLDCPSWMHRQLGGAGDRWPVRRGMRSMLRPQDGVSDPSLDMWFWLELVASGQGLRFCLSLQCAEVSHYSTMQPQLFIWGSCALPVPHRPHICIWKPEGQRGSVVGLAVLGSWLDSMS